MFVFRMFKFFFLRFVKTIIKEFKHKNHWSRVSIFSSKMLDRRNKKKTLTQNVIVTKTKQKWFVRLIFFFFLPFSVTSCNQELPQNDPLLCISLTLKIVWFRVWVKSKFVWDPIIIIGTIFIQAHVWMCFASNHIALISNCWIAVYGIAFAFLFKRLRNRHTHTHSLIQTHIIRSIGFYSDISQTIGKYSRKENIQHVFGGDVESVLT